MILKKNKIENTLQNRLIAETSAYCWYRYRPCLRRIICVGGTRKSFSKVNNLVPWSRLLIHPCGVEGAHDFLGNSANTDLIRQAKGEPGQALVPIPTLETNKFQFIIKILAFVIFELALDYLTSSLCIWNCAL